ncbi:MULTISPECIES: hypothetical protein [Acidithiobacillus]|jgi:2-methylisocitrate lyase-like PEP mutase family enzyme|uniref:hypothetical protein n=1 Tax=Acidithiobacillus TaxID=119977 RepID=UPI001C076694|nr:hypothetical protein [Acidithiobacillus ferrooxidans]MBU2809768.1 hypothetical protein [Acidithiobacillus ferrooxidans F221]
MDTNSDSNTVLDLLSAAATVAALAGRASSSDFVCMANRLADATQGTLDEAVYRALADKMPQEDSLWYETPVGYELAKRIVLGDLDNNARIDHLH